MRIDGDATLLVSWVMDALLLWAVGRLGGYPRPFRRAAAGAAVGTVPTLLVLLGAGGPEWVALVAAPLCMIWVYLRPVPRAVFWRGVAWLVGLTVAAGGLATALYEVGMPVAVALSGTGLAIMAGATIWRRPLSGRFRRRDGLIAVRLWIEHTPHPLTALIDSGNRLGDPNGECPVAVADWSAVRSKVSPEMARWVTETLAGARPTALRRDDLWLLDVRTATGRRRLPVLAVSHAEWEVDGQWQPLGPLALALTDQILSPRGDFQILLPEVPADRRARPGA